jgi:hypothetical protein
MIENLVIAPTKIVRPDIAVASLVSKLKNAISIGTMIPPPPIPLFIK